MVPQNLRTILESKDILKIGVNITSILQNLSVSSLLALTRYSTDDAKRMYEYHHVLPQGLFELSDLENLLIAAKVGEGRIARRLIALSKLVEQHLLLPLRKGPVRMSNWMTPLTSVQIRCESSTHKLWEIHRAEYIHKKIDAASDAYAGLRVFDAQEKKRRELDPSPPLPACRILVTTTEIQKKTQE